MMYKILGISLILAALATACGASSGGNSNSDSSSSNSNSNGNALFVIPPIDNNTSVTTPTGPQVANFTVADMTTFQYPVFQGIAGIDATIVLNSTANGCTDSNSNTFHVGETQLVINLTDIPDQQQIAANTYVFPASANTPYEISSATYAVVDAPCYYNSVSLVSGQVVVTDVETASLSGTYDLTFASGSISGTFTAAPTCAAVGTTPATAPACN